MEKLQIRKYQLTTVYGLLIIEAKDISYIKGQNNYALLMDVMGNDHFICQSLKQLGTLLYPKTFIRVHKSYVINTQHIYQFHKKGEGSLILRCGATVPVGRTYRNHVLQVLQQGFS